MIDMMIKRETKLNLGYLGRVEGSNIDANDAVSVLAGCKPNKNRAINLDDGFTKVIQGPNTYYIVKRYNCVEVAKQMPLVENDEDFTWELRHWAGGYCLQSSYGKTWNNRCSKINNSNFWFTLAYDLDRMDTEIVMHYTMTRGTQTSRKERICFATNKEIKAKMQQMMEIFKEEVNGISLDFKENSNE